jgi:hypothetical protein
MFPSNLSLVKVDCIELIVPYLCCGGASNLALVSSLYIHFRLKLTIFEPAAPPLKVNLVVC